MLKKIALVSAAAAVLLAGGATTAFGAGWVPGCGGTGAGCGYVDANADGVCDRFVQGLGSASGNVASAVSQQVTAAGSVARSSMPMATAYAITTPPVRRTARETDTVPPMVRGRVTTTLHPAAGMARAAPAGARVQRASEPVRVLITVPVAVAVMPVGHNPLPDAW